MAKKKNKKKVTKKTAKKKDLISFFNSQNKNQATLSKIYVCWNQIDEREECSCLYTFEDGTTKEGKSWHNNQSGGCLEFEESEESSYSCADNFLGLSATLKDKSWGKYEDQFADFSGEGKSIDYEYDGFEDEDVVGYEHLETYDCEKDIPVEPSHLDLKLIHETEELSFRFVLRSEDADGVGEYALNEWDSNTSSTQISGSVYNLDDISELIKHLTK